MIDADSVNHLTSITLHHMKRLVPHFGLRTVLLRFQVEGGVHVHGNRFNLWCQGDLVQPFVGVT